MKIYRYVSLVLLAALSLSAAAQEMPERQAVLAGAVFTDQQDVLRARVEAVKAEMARFRLIHDGDIWRCVNGYGKTGLNKADDFYRTRNGECMDLAGAVLTGLDLGPRNLRGADLRGADLTNADLDEADFSHADLRGARLAHATMTRMKLVGTDLRRADLRGADLEDSDITSADLSGADVRGTRLPKTAKLP